MSTSSKKWVSKTLQTITIVSAVASAEAKERYAMPVGSGPGVNAHSCAPDACIDFLANLGFNPEVDGEAAMRLIVELMSVGYCIGSEHADERNKDDLEGYTVIETETLDYLRREVALLRAERDAKHRELVNTIAKLGKAEGVQRSIKRIIEESENPSV